MDFPTFNLNRYYSLRNKDGDMLAFSAFNGQSSITVWKKNESGKPSLKVNIGCYAAAKLMKKLNELLAVPTEARVPLVFSAWNRDSKAFEADCTVCLVKDDKAMYSIELSGHGTSAKFNIQSSQHISDGSSTTTKEMRSHEGVIELITILNKYIPLADMLSSFRLPKSGNDNKPANRDPFNKPKPASTAGVSTVDDDDVLF